jgi:hypothetical protein
VSEGLVPVELPQFRSPPVVEIVGAVQFISLPRLGLQDIVRVGNALTDLNCRSSSRSFLRSMRFRPVSPTLRNCCSALGSNHSVRCSAALTVDS